MIAPYWIAEIQIAGVGGRTHNRTADGAYCGARGHAARGRADKRAGARTDQCARCRAIARIGAAAGKSQNGSRRRDDGEFSNKHHYFLRVGEVTAQRLPAFRSSSWLFRGTAIMELP